MVTMVSGLQVSASSSAEMKPATRRLSRRSLLQAGAAATLAAPVLGFPFIRNARAAELELRWLGWEHYNVKELTAAFEQEHGVKVSAGFFDGNSEAYNKLRAGGTQDFDLVMADGFWPRLYAAGPDPAGRLRQARQSRARVPRLPAAQLHAAAGGGRRGDDRRAQLLAATAAVNTDEVARRTRRRSACCSTRPTRGICRPAPDSRRTSRLPAFWPPTRWARSMPSVPMASRSTRTS